ncbi:MAG: LLM class flavin-dependent oxidoreductase [Chloroflexi bacterium]|nr:LLM class flavin-dependent oxidoreductase [Chloroflexota bacterium]
MTNSFRLGFLTHFDGVGDPSRVYQNTLELYTAADQLGFDVGWIAQHHLQGQDGRLPSPFPFLAAASERTKRIRLGTAIAILPLENPIRLAEDAAVVDTLSGGRLELGIGSGFDPVAYKAFGVDIEKRRELTTAGLSTLLQALRGEPIGSTDGPRLQPPVPTLADRVWQGIFSEQGARYAAQAGVGLLLNRATYGYDEPTDQVQKPWAKAYLETWNGRPIKPRIGLSRIVYPGADKRTTQTELQDGILHAVNRLVKTGKFPAGLTTEGYFKRLHVFHGHPDEVAAELGADQVFPHITDLICQFNPGVPSLDQALRAFELIATKVAPALGWRPKHEASGTEIPSAKASTPNGALPTPEVAYAR